MDKGQVETKMLSALLSGVNRAFHYVQGRKHSGLAKTMLNVISQVQMDLGLMPACLGLANVLCFSKNIFNRTWIMSKSFHLH